MQQSSDLNMLASWLMLDDVRGGPVVPFADRQRQQGTNVETAVRYFARRCCTESETSGIIFKVNIEEMSFRLEHLHCWAICTNISNGFSQTNCNVI